MLALYFITFLAYLTITIGLFLTHRRLITNIVILSLILTVSSLGRYLVAASRSLDMAVLGIVFMQVASAFSPLLLIVMLMKMCGVRPSNPVTWMMTGLSTLVFLLTLPIPGMRLFYKDLALSHSHGCTYLVRSFGPLHFLYPLMLVCYMLVCVALLIEALRNNRKAHIRTVIVTVTIVVIIMIFFLMDKLTHNSIDYSIHGYFLSMLLLMWHMERSNMYDLTTNISESIQALNSNGYIQFDRSLRCTAVNQVVRDLFPEVDETWYMGRKIPENHTFLYDEVIQWFYRRSYEEKKTIAVADRFYELHVRKIPYMCWSCAGYMLALVDRTSDIRYMRAMENYQVDLEREVQKKTEHIARIRDAMVVGMASLVESRDDSTGGHIKRTYSVTRVFTEHLKAHCEELGITPEFLDMVARAAPMHDLGKIVIDDAVLKKQGRFTVRDFEVMKIHPQEGARIVREILSGVEDPEFVDIAANVAHYHHEKWDGSGYPQGLRGEEIPLEGRIMALPDVFDALSRRRRYKEALPYDVVFPIIEEGLGTHFDPRLGRWFLECRDSLEEMYRTWDEEELEKEHLHLAPSRAPDFHRKFPSKV